MSNVIGTASTTQQLQLEALNEVIKLLIEKEAKLDARISERGSITTVSLAIFRLRFQNPVTKTLADVAVQMAKNRDQFLQQAGDGKIGQVDTSYAGGGANPIILASQPWGARLISQGQQVQVMSNTYTLRGTCYVTNVNNKLGSAQSITVDTVPSGTTVGDYIMVAGV